MVISLLILNILVFILLASLHIYWALGGSWGIEAVMPTDGNGRRVFKAGSLGTFGVSLFLLLFAIADLAYCGWLDLGMSNGIPNTMLGIGILFLLRAIGDFKYVGFSKRRRQSTFSKMDTRFYSPLCLFIALVHCLAYWASL